VSGVPVTRLKDAEMKIEFLNQRTKIVCCDATAFGDPRRRYARKRLTNLLRLSFNSFNTLLDISRFICANELEIQWFKNRRDLASPLPLERGMTRRFQVRFKERAQADLLGGRSSSPSIELQHSFSSIIAGIWPSVDLVMRFVSKFREQDGSEANIEMALHEALTNAVVHGNHEDPHKLVHVACAVQMGGCPSQSGTRARGSTPAQYPIRPKQRICCPLTGAEFISCARSWMKFLSMKVA
jgi:hypothetical protein